MREKVNSFIVFIFFIINCATAQEVPKIIQFQRADYKAGHQNWMITQDCDGYLYVANTEGVLIFNGFKWQQVSLPKNEKPRSVYLGKDCRIYTGAFESFGYIDVSDRNEPFYQPMADSLLKNSNQEVWNIFGNESQILFQSFSNLYRYDYKNFSRIITPSNIMLGKNVNDELLIPKIEQGLYKIETKQIIENSTASELPNGTKIADLCASDQPGKVILGTQYNGIFILKENKLVAVNSELNERFKKEQINKLLRLSNGSYAVGTILNGVYITDDFLSVKYHISKSNGLSNNTVLSLFEDKNNDLWVGLDKGINLIKISDPLTYFYDRQGKLGTIFTAIHYNNSLYLGTNQGVFKSNSDGFFTLIDDSQGQIWSFIIIDGDLICGHNKGTYQIKNDEFIKISDITGGWCMEAIGENLILQSTYTGFAVLEKKDGEWIQPRRVKEGNILIENFVLSENTLVGYHSYYGINIVKFSENFNKVVSNKLIDKINHDDWDQGPVNLIASAKRIILSLGSMQYILESDSLRRMSEAEIAMLEKEEQFSFQRRFYESVKEISKFENLSTYQFFRPEESEKAFILGFDEGYLLVPADFKHHTPSLSPSNIDFINVNGRIYKSYDDLIFPPAQNDLTVQIKDTSFFNSGNTLKYKLENWDEEWHDIPPDGELDFINLDDGNYVLKIVDYSEKPFTLLQFEIKPHWYESWIGAILYAALVFLFIWYLDKRNKRKLKWETEKLQKEKERELESERIKAKNDKLEREVIYKSKMLANSTLALVQKNKMLNNLKEFIAKDDLGDINDPYYKQRIVNLINRNINHDQDWEIFEKNFAEIHEDFLERVKTKYPDITAGELKLAAYIRMNLSSKEIAPLLNISLRSVENKRYRLRKKMKIEHDNNLSDHLLRL